MIETVARPNRRPRSAILSLEAIAQAYASGDNPLAEALFFEALDDDLPWTDVCAAAARGIARRYGGPRNG